MKNHVEWLRLAEQDLIGIGDRSIIAQLLDIAANDLPLEFLPKPNPDQGGVEGRQPPLAWRRGTRSAQTMALGQTLDGHSDNEVENWSDRSCDYYLVYREPRFEEHSEAGMHGRILGFVVVRVLQQADLALMGRIPPEPAPELTPH